MATTHQTLLDQLRLTAREISRRKEYFNITPADSRCLVALHEVIAARVDWIIEQFYSRILPFSEMDQLIGDADTLTKLRNHQRLYILSLFEGEFDEEYVQSRLRVGVVHKRIGVEPKYYVSAAHQLSVLLKDVITEAYSNDNTTQKAAIDAINKVMAFDLSLIFDTYIHSLMEEVKRSKDELEHYAESLEEIIGKRTQLLKEQARHDALTGLLNQHYFYKELRRELARGARRAHSTSLIYFDLDGFKQLNDTRGHREGDRVLMAVSEAVKSVIREGEIAARYGGDEFCIIMPESNAMEARVLCKRICEHIEDRTEGSGISCSMGIATSSPDRNIDAITLVKMADQAMYKGKMTEGFSIQIVE